jgi:chitinase
MPSLKHDNNTLRRSLSLGRLVASVVLPTLVFGVSLRAQELPREVIGYYPSWTWRGRTHVMTPDLIPYDRLTMINYAFFIPHADGTITGTDSTGDDLILRGTLDSTTGLRQPSTSLIFLAHKNGVKVLMSIGGWGGSGNFPALAAHITTRQRFAHSCMDALRKYGFDGVDIDWEYPGYVEHNGTPNDADNFTHLLMALRDSLDSQGKISGQRYPLTAALPAGNEHAAGIHMKDIAKVLDLMNVMTYDFYGPWEPKSGHNAPLFPQKGGDSTRSVDSAFRLYHDTYGIPPEKIGLGIPFYGHAFTQCTSLDSPHHGDDNIHFPHGGANFINIMAAMPHFQRYWDSLAQVPYLVSTDWNEFVSYDDTESVRLKCEYAIDHGVRGMIIWEITGDFMPDGTHPLLDVVSSVLRKNPPLKH